MQIYPNWTKETNRGSPLQDNEKLIRLQVFIARAGLASRRKADKIIQEGKITVNGLVTRKLGTKVLLTDDIRYLGKPLRIEEHRRYVLLYKPKGYVSSMEDEDQRFIASDIIKQAFCERLYNVGRLDMYSEGLLLFTNDGILARALMHPSTLIQKEYIIVTSLPIPLSLAYDFENGIKINGVLYKCLYAERLSAHRMDIILTEGKNREIRKVFSYMNIGIKRLVRVRYASLEIDDLQQGQYRELTKDEVQSLYTLCNL